MICGDCLYRKNCQLLGRHKKPLVVEGCTAFVNEADFIARHKSQAIKEFAERVCEGRISNDPVVIAVRCAVKEMTEGKDAGKDI